MAHQRNTKGRTKAPSQERSQRQLRVGEELRHALARVLARGELRDPRLSDVSLTVTEVRVSPDLKSATAFVVPLGGGELEPVIAALNHANAFLRGQLSREVALRHTPRLSFQADISFDEADHINAILHHPRVAQDISFDGAGDRDIEDGQGEDVPPGPEHDPDER